MLRPASRGASSSSFHEKNNPAGSIPTRTQEAPNHLGGTAITPAVFGRREPPAGACRFGDYDLLMACTTLNAVVPDSRPDTPAASAFDIVEAAADMPVGDSLRLAEENPEDPETAEEQLGTVVPSAGRALPPEDRPRRAQWEASAEDRLPRGDWVASVAEN